MLVGRSALVNLEGISFAAHHPESVAVLWEIVILSIQKFPVGGVAHAVHDVCHNHGGSCSTLFTAFVVDGGDVLKDDQLRSLLISQALGVVP